MKYDRAPRPLSAVTLRPPRKVDAPVGAWRPPPRPPEPTRPVTPASTAATSATPSSRTAIPRTRTIFGQRAVWQAIQTQLNALHQIWFSSDQRAALAPILPILTGRGVACTEVADAALAQVAGTHGHQGIVVVVRVG